MEILHTSSPDYDSPYWRFQTQHWWMHRPPYRHQHSCAARWYNSSRLRHKIELHLSSKRIQLWQETRESNSPLDDGHSKRVPRPDQQTCISPIHFNSACSWLEQITSAQWIAVKKMNAQSARRQDLWQSSIFGIILNTHRDPYRNLSQDIVTPDHHRQHVFQENS